MRPFATIFLASSAVAIAACGGGGDPVAGASCKTGNSPTGLSCPPPPPLSPPPPPPSGGGMLAFAEEGAARGLAFATSRSRTGGMPGEFAGGAAAGDVDGDGDVDLVIVRGDDAGNLLLLNDGDGRFAEATPPALAFPDGGDVNRKLSGPVLADMDGDGALDLFIGGVDGDASVLLRGDGAGGFADAMVGSGLDAMGAFNTLSAALGDVDGDDDLDLALAHWGTPRDATAPGDTETLWRNISTPGTIRFESATLDAGVALDTNSATGVLGPGHDYSFAPAFADFDMDGHLDLFMVGDFRTSQIFRNKGDGTFEDATDRTQITDTNGMGASAGDVTGDGRPDMFASSIDGNRLYESALGGLVRKADSGLEAGGWGWASCMADFDLDGDLDVYQTNGWVNDGGSNPQEPYSADRTRLWLNGGNGVFENGAVAAGIDDAEQGRGAICFDADGDGDVDVLQTLSKSDPGVRLYINTLDSGRGVHVRAKGVAPNTAGIGVKLELAAGGFTQTRWLGVNSNFTSHDPASTLFGLGPAGSGELTVTWPDERTQIFTVGPGDRIVADTANAK